MTDQEIIEMAKKFSMTSDGKYFVPNKDIIAFARLIAKRQKERDVVIVREFPYWIGDKAKEEIAAAILAEED